LMLEDVKSLLRDPAILRACMILRGPDLYYLPHLEKITSGFARYILGVDKSPIFEPKDVLGIEYLIREAAEEVKRVRIIGARFFRHLGAFIEHACEFFDVWSGRLHRFYGFAPYGVKIHSVGRAVETFLRGIPSYSSRKRVKTYLTEIDKAVNQAISKIKREEGFSER